MPRAPKAPERLKAAQRHPSPSASLRRNFCVLLSGGFAVAGSDSNAYETFEAHHSQRRNRALMQLASSGFRHVCSSWRRRTSSLRPWRR